MPAPDGYLLPRGACSRGGACSGRSGPGGVPAPGILVLEVFGEKVETIFFRRKLLYSLKKLDPGLRN